MRGNIKYLCLEFKIKIPLTRILNADKRELKNQIKRNPINCLIYSQGISGHVLISHLHVHIRENTRSVISQKMPVAYHRFFLSS